MLAGLLCAPLYTCAHVTHRCPRSGSDQLSYHNSRQLLYEKYQSRVDVTDEKGVDYSFKAIGKAFVLNGNGLKATYSMARRRGTAWWQLPYPLSTENTYFLETKQ